MTDKPKSPANLSFKSIAGIAVEWIFPFAYALTVTPFTVQFFNFFVNPLSDKEYLFGVFQLSQVHAFFLPLFILTVEIISTRVATNWWRDLFFGRYISLVGLTVVFVCLQFFPTFSTYFDFRLRVYNDLQGTKRLQQETTATEQEQAKLDEIYSNKRKDIDQKYEIARKDFISKSENLSKMISDLEKEIRDLKVQLEVIDKSTATSLEIVQKPIGIDASKEAAKNLEYQKSSGKQIQTLIDQKERDLQSLRLDLRQLSPPIKAEYPEPTKAQRTPLQLNGQEQSSGFLLRTASDPDSILNLTMAFIFPMAVFGAGNVLARKETNYDGGSDPESNKDTKFKPENERELYFTMPILGSLLMMGFFIVALLIFRQSLVPISLLILLGIITYLLRRVLEPKIVSPASKKQGIILNLLISWAINFVGGFVIYSLTGNPSITSISALGVAAAASSGVTSTMSFLSSSNTRT